MLFECMLVRVRKLEQIVVHLPWLAPVGRSPSCSCYVEGCYVWRVEDFNFFRVMSRAMTQLIRFREVDP